MCDKTKIGFIHGSVDSQFLAALTERLERECPGEFEVVEISAVQPEGCHPFDHVLPTAEAVNRQLFALSRQPFHKRYEDRIDRYNRVWPRHGCPMLTWNRDLKWLPRFYASPRKFYFSQSQLRLSQVMSWREPSISLRNSVCSLEDLDLSRWP